MYASWCREGIPLSMLLDKEFMYHEMFVDIYGRQIDSFYIRKFRNYFRESKNCTAPLCIKRYV